jgi:hypothetical protein
MDSVITSLCVTIFSQPHFLHRKTASPSKTARHAMQIALVFSDAVVIGVTILCFDETRKLRQAPLLDDRLVGVSMDCSPISLVFDWFEQNRPLLDAINFGGTRTTLESGEIASARVEATFVGGVATYTASEDGWIEIEIRGPAPSARVLARLRFNEVADNTLNEAFGVVRGILARLAAEATSDLKAARR